MLPPPPGKRRKTAVALGGRPSFAIPISPNEYSPNNPRDCWGGIHSVGARVSPPIRRQRSDPPRWFGEAREYIYRLAPPLAPPKPHASFFQVLKQSEKKAFNETSKGSGPPLPRGDESPQDDGADLPPPPLVNYVVPLPPEVISGIFLALLACLA